MPETLDESKHLLHVREPYVRHTFTVEGGMDSQIPDVVRAETEKLFNNCQLWGKTVRTAVTITAHI